MVVKLFGLKNCDKCRKAVKDLTASGHEVSFVDIRENTPSNDVLASWVAETSKDEILNTRSTTWRGLSEDERQISNDAALVDLLQKHPTLIKRPVVLFQNAIYVGWTNKTPL